MLVEIQQARMLLENMGFDAERSNKRSAILLLGLLDLRPGDSWDRATNPARGVTPLMEHARLWDAKWKPNTRETVRKRTLQHFVQSGLVEYNHDDPVRAVNSPHTNYRISPKALAVIVQRGQVGEEEALSEYLRELPGQVDAYRAARDMHRIPVTLPDGTAVTLSPGGQNVLIRKMVEEFCPRFSPGGRVLYLGDADSKLTTFDEAAFADLGVTVNHHGKMPDLIVYLPDRGWLVLLEAVTTHGPIDAKRRVELQELLYGSTAGIVYVSCFPDRATMRRYLADLAWETEAWVADEPDHLMHLNGERFLGPH